jgi:hypothetical protein
MKMRKTRGYMHRIVAATEKRPDLFKRGEVSMPKVAHDGWCKSNSGKVCNCYPDIKLETPLGVFSIDHAGECHSLPSAVGKSTVYDPDLGANT